MKSRFLGWFKRFVSKEIMIEYKSCLYFACILFFYFMWLLCKGIYSASILFMFEMILAAYFVGYFQVYVFRNFDEAEQIEKKAFWELYSASAFTALFPICLAGLRRALELACGFRSIC